MFIVDFLRNPNPDVQERDVMFAEYRLLCEGVLHNSVEDSSTVERRDLVRMLLLEPVQLFVASLPVNAYPQELALRFKTHYIEEKIGESTVGYYAGQQIAHDIAAILTVLVRRLITVIARVSERFPAEAPNLPKEFDQFLKNFPIGILSSTKLNRTPISTIATQNVRGIGNLEGFKPGEVGIDPKDLSAQLMAVGKLDCAETFVFAARQYSLAVELVDNRPELAFQLLISAMEALASKVLASYAPPEEEAVSKNRALYKEALSLGLDSNGARKIALYASRDDPWTFRKFREFILAHVDDTLWVPDALYRGILGDYVVSQAVFPKALSNIYRCRNKALHAARPYPLGAKLGLCSTPPFQQEYRAGAKDDPPPVLWFERVVNMVLRNFAASGTV